MINIRTLDLRLSDKMVSQEVSVVLSSALNLVQTLVGVEAQLLALLIQLLRLFTKHEFERFVLVFQQFVSPTLKLFF